MSDDAAHILVVDDDDRLRDLLQRYLGEYGFRVSVAAGAAEARVAMSGDQLDRRMKRVFRLSTKKYIMKSRLEKATRLLVHSDQSLVEIASQCGFADQSAFTRHFRAVVQVTPAIYRKQQQKRD